MDYKTTLPYTNLKFDPFIKQPSIVELTQQTRLGDGKSRLFRVAPTADNITKIVISLVAQNGIPSHQWQRLKLAILVGTVVVLKIPKFDMSISHRDKVIAALCKRDCLHFDRNFVGSDNVVVLPVPYIDQHVVL